VPSKMNIEEIQNVYCVGRNYRLHAAELGNEVPKQPLIFMKPTHAVIVADGQHVTLPANQGELQHELEMVLKIGSAYQPGKRVAEMVTQVGLGLDLTLRDVQTTLKQKGHPWLAAKGFRSSAILGKLKPFQSMEACQQPFYLKKNGNMVQQGEIKDMIFDLQTLIDYIGSHYGLGAGDLIYTGTPSGVGALTHGDQLEMVWGEESLGTFTVNMKDEIVS
jgi:fumarylpyruvate hydrolase